MGANDKLREKYVGKTVEMFSNGWNCKIVDVDKYGWTFQITKPYYNNHNDHIGDILFYGHEAGVKFKIIN